MLEEVVEHKTIKLRDLLVKDTQCVRNDPSLKPQDLLPDQPVWCLDGYANKVIKWRQFFLRESINDDSTMSLPLSKYIRHLKHSEESDD